MTRIITSLAVRSDRILLRPLRARRQGSAAGGAIGRQTACPPGHARRSHTGSGGGGLQPAGSALAAGRLEWPLRREPGTVNRGSPTRDSLAAAPNAARSEAPAHKVHRLTEFSPLDRTIAAARDALISLQSSQGYWLFELEADCYHSRRVRPDDALPGGNRCSSGGETRSLSARSSGRAWRLASVLRWRVRHELQRQGVLRLKLAGDSPLAPHMVRARAAILQRGGAARSNVFTRITLALFGQIPWRGVPYIPVEIVLLPRWFPFHLNKVSYWSRTVMVPLLILCTRKPLAANPRKVQIRELFTTARPSRSATIFDAPAARRHSEPGLSGARPARPHDRSAGSQRYARVRHAARGGLGARTVERRGRPRCHLSRHGQRARSAGGPWLCQQRPAPARRQACPREASGGQCVQRLLPAVCVTGLG